MTDDKITDQITELARLLPAEAAPDLSADRLQILKEHLMVEYRLAAGNRRPTPQRRRVRRPLLRGPGRRRRAGRRRGDRDRPGPVRGPARSGQPGGGGAAREGRQRRRPAAAPAVSNSEFMYIRSEVSYAVPTTTEARSPTMEPLHERQIWQPVANICDWGLVIEEGQRTRSRHRPQRPVLLRVRPGQPERRHLPAAAVAPDRPAHAAQPDLRVQPEERRGSRHWAATARPSSRSETSSARRSCRRRPPPRCTGRRRSSPA